MMQNLRQRIVLCLGLLALLLALLAGLALYRQESRAIALPEPQTMFIGLAGKVRDVARIQIHSQAHGAFEIAFKPEQGWVLPQRGDYPASFDVVRRIIHGMASLQLIEPRTGRVDWLRYLDLNSPSSGGKGVLITLSDANGKVLASLIAGKAQEIGDGSGLGGLFVRRPDSTQSWLARGILQVEPQPAGWMDRKMVEIERARIKQVEVTPVTGTAFRVFRETPGEADFRLAPMPQGRSLNSPYAAEAVASAMVGFAFEDIRPATQMNFTQAARIVTQTFDGLEITTDVTARGGDLWARLSMRGLTPAARKEAEALDARAGRWAYKLPLHKGQQFMTTLDDLLKPVGTP